VSSDVVVVEAGERGRDLEAEREVQGRAGVACPEGMASPAGLGSFTFDLGDGVHREGAGPVEPELVPGAFEELQERKSVAGGTVAEVRALTSGPARHVSSPPASSSRSCSSSPGAMRASDETIPGAP